MVVFSFLSNLFYQFDVDFGVKHPANGRQIVLSKIDPTNGKTTKVNVTGDGASDYVTGFCIEKSSNAVLISSKNENGVFNFFSVDHTILYKTGFNAKRCIF